MMEIAAVDRFEQPVGWTGELQDQQPALGAENPVDLCQALLAIDKVSHPKGHGTTTKDIPESRNGLSISAERRDSGTVGIVLEFLHPSPEHILAEVQGIDVPIRVLPGYLPGQG